MRHSILPAFTAALLAACGGPAGNDGAQVAGNTEAAPVAADQATANGESSVVYPGAQVTGDRFVTSDPIDRVLAWYWDPEQPMRQRNGQTWGVDKPERRDDGYLVAVTVMGDEDSDRFAIYLNPGVGGGTDGRVRPITDKEIREGVKL